MNMDVTAYVYGFRIVTYVYSFWCIIHGYAQVDRDKRNKIKTIFNNDLSQNN